MKTLERLFPSSLLPLSLPFSSLRYFRDLLANKKKKPTLGKRRKMIERQDKVDDKKYRLESRMPITVL